MSRGRTPAACLAGILWAAAALGQAPTPSPAPAPTPPPATTPAAASPAPAPAAAPTPEALPKCADCHTDTVAAFAKNPHFLGLGATKKADAEDTCATCHGDGTKHVESGGDASLISVPRGAAGAQDCLACHESGKAAFSDGARDSFAKGTQETFHTGVHANTDAVNCLTCHSMHKPAPKSMHLLAKAPGELCATCHTTQSASFKNKPYSHRLDRGGMTCLDCHLPHAQSPAVKMTTQGELPCLNCHSEVRGPFVFDHVTGSGGTCLSCHQPHGSNNPKMLLWARVDQLCLSCHSQTGGPKTFGSQPPSFHDLTQPRYRNCTTCQVAVHGSNLSPQLLK